MGRPAVRGRSHGSPAQWGYDGLEIACVGATTWTWSAPARTTPMFGRRREILDRHGLKVYAISNHLTGQAVCDDPIDFRHQAIVRPSTWGDGDPEGVRQRAAEDMKRAARVARKLGADTVVGFTGSKIWPYVAMFPPVPASVIDEGYEDFARRWNPILDVFDAEGVRFAHEVHPAEIAYDYWSSVRALETIGHREAFGFNWDPSHMMWQNIDPVGFIWDFQKRIYHVDCQGHPAAPPQRARRSARLAPAVGRPAPQLGLRLHRARRRALGGCLPGPGIDRLRRPCLDRMGGCRYEPAARCRPSRRVCPRTAVGPARDVLRRRFLQPVNPRG
ncbi:sugar phosphate isomerase/epimerase family protein [Streptomyces sp. L7]